VEISSLLVSLSAHGDFRAKLEIVYLPGHNGRDFFYFGVLSTLPLTLVVFGYLRIRDPLFRFALLFFSVLLSLVTGTGLSLMIHLFS
jgi:hypothetical protein